MYWLQTVLRGSVALCVVLLVTACSDRSGQSSSNGTANQDERAQEQRTANPQGDNDMARRDEEDVLSLPVERARDDREHRAELQCFCNQERQPTAELRWRADRDAISSDRIDLTIYKRGFEKQIFTTLWPVNERRELQVPPTAELPERGGNDALFPAVTFSYDERASMAVARFTGLESGLNYTFRIASRDEERWLVYTEHTCLAPVCPGDEAEPE